MPQGTSFSTSRATVKTPSLWTQAVTAVLVRSASLARTVTQAGASSLKRSTGKNIASAAASTLTYIRGFGKTILWSAPTSFIRSQVATVSRLLTLTQGSSFTQSAVKNSIHAFTVILTFVQHVGRGGVQTALTMAFTQTQNLAKRLAITRQTAAVQTSSYSYRLATARAYLVGAGTALTQKRALQKGLSWAQAVILRNIFGSNAFAVTLAFAQRVGHAKQFVEMVFQQTQSYLSVIGRSLRINIFLTQAQLISTTRSAVRSLVIFVQGIAPFQQPGQGSLFAISLSTTTHVFFATYTAVQSAAFSLRRAVTIQSWKANAPTGISLRRSVTRVQSAAQTTASTVIRGFSRLWTAVSTSSFALRRGVGISRTWSAAAVTALTKSAAKTWAATQSASASFLAARLQKLVTLAVTQAQTLTFARQAFLTRAISQGQNYLYTKRVAFIRSLQQSTIYRASSQTTKSVLVAILSTPVVTRATRHFVAVQTAINLVVSISISQLLEFITVTQQAIAQINKRVGKRLTPPAVMAFLSTAIRKGTHRIKKKLAWRFMGD